MSGPTVNLSKAAELCGLSVSTLRRKRDVLMEAGATRHDGAWEIPITALISLGLMDNMTAPGASKSGHNGRSGTHHDGAHLTASEASAVNHSKVIDELRAQLAHKDVELAKATTAKEYLEQLILEKDKRMALLMGPSTGNDEVPDSLQERQPVEPKQRRWGRRR